MGKGEHDGRRKVLGRGLLIGGHLGFLLALAGLVTSGCAQNELGIYTGYNKPVIKNPQRVRNAIVRSENYWIQKEVVPEEQFPGPTPADLKTPSTDYILGPGDLIDITVFELMQPGQPYLTRQRISQSGQITFPYIGSVKTAGLTTRGLEEKLASMLEPDYIRNPQINVFVSEFRNLNVSILNGVMRPGIYPMTKQDMNLLELVAMAGGVLQLVEDYGYVIRKYTPEEADLLMLEAGTLPAEGEKAGTPGAPKSEEKEGPPAKPSEKTVPAAPKTGEKAATEPAPKAGETAPAAVGPKAAEKTSAETPKPAEKTPPKAEEKAPAAPAPKAEEKAPAAPAPKPAAKAPADSSREARELLEKMASGEMPPVQKIEAAEVAAEKKAATDKKTPAAGEKTAAAEKAPAAPVKATGTEKKSPETETKAPAAGEIKTASAATSAVPGKEEKELGRWVWSDGKWVEVKSEAPAEKIKPGETKPAVAAKPAEVKKPAEAEKPAEVKKPVEVKKPAESAPPEEVKVAAAEPEAKAAEEPRIQLEQKLRRLGVVQGAGQLKRIIRFDVQSLQAGDPTQNLVLRDSDVVSIPSPPMGDFYMGGEVARPGVYSLTGRKITLLQAIAAAGGLTAVAVPWRTEVVRRLNETEEEIIYVDISRIARGEVPDFYMQPEDLIRVGTDQGAIYNAVFRNAFRATYGLGGVYDTNFADFYPWSLQRIPIIGPRHITP